MSYVLSGTLYFAGKAVLNKVRNVVDDSVIED